jgi:hypothetical protein
MSLFDSIKAFFGSGTSKDDGSIASFFGSGSTRSEQASALTYPREAPAVVNTLATLYAEILDRDPADFLPTNSGSHSSAIPKKSDGLFG